MHLNVTLEIHDSACLTISIFRYLWSTVSRHDTLSLYTIDTLPYQYASQIPTLCVCCVSAYVCQVFHDMLSIQAGVTLIASVLPSVTAVKTIVNNQFEIFALDNGQATISL